MPRKQAAANDVQSALSAIRKSLESMPVSDLARVLNDLRAEQTDRVTDAFNEAWRTVTAAADEHHALTGFGLPVPSNISDVFNDSPIAPGTPKRTHPDAWYTYEVTNLIHMCGDDAPAREFILNFVEARGGDPRHAERNTIPQLEADGFIVNTGDDTYALANSRPDAWYDYNIMAFVNEADPSDLPTTRDIHDHVIACGGHGAEAVTTAIPRLTSAGSLVEKGEGVWDSACRKPDAWYDYEISAFVNAHNADRLPTTKTIHDHVINMGGHGAIAVSEALPRLRDAGHLVETQDGVWDCPRRKPDAWYDYTVLNFFYTEEDNDPITTAEVNEYVIEEGGHGAEAVMHCLPRLSNAGKIEQTEDGAWQLAVRRPRAWYDHAVISMIRAATPDTLPTYKQMQDEIIARGGHGAFIAATVLPDLVEQGELVEIEPGLYDVTNRRADIWYDHTVLGFVNSAEDTVSTMEIFEHVMDQGGHGAEVASTVLPRLERNGMIERASDMGEWRAGTGIPHALIEEQVLNAVRDFSPEPASIEEIGSKVDKDINDPETLEHACERLSDAELIEASGDNWTLPGVKPRPKRAASGSASTTRRRRSRAAA
ncbi:MAG: hypothetical protein AAGH64_02725 [Planctomycetota bacterium]